MAMALWRLLKVAGSAALHHHLGGGRAPVCARLRSARRGGAAGGAAARRGELRCRTGGGHGRRLSVFCYKPFVGDVITPNVSLRYWSL